MANYPSRTRRILDIRSLNQCAFPGCTSILVEPGIGEAGPAVVADTCHIYARRPGGKRWKEGLTEEERNSIDNLILLCKNHHAIVDSQPEVYTAEQLKRWKSEHEAKIPGEFPGRDLISEVLGERIRQDTSRLRQLRFYPTFDAVSLSLAFARDLIEGELSIGPDIERAPALAWCARVLSHTEHLAKARECLSLGKTLPACAEMDIVDAYLSSTEQDKSTALEMLLSQDSSMYRSAAFALVMGKDGTQGAIDWLKDTQIKVSDLDSEGKLRFLGSCLEMGDLNAARMNLHSVTREDLQETPFLFRMTAVIHLLEAVPAELRSIIVGHQVPFGGKAFPLSEDSDAMKERRKARNLFLRSAEVAKELDCLEEAAVDEEYALWLDLMDPDEADSSRKALARKLSDPESRDGLRFVRLAAEFDIKLDHGAIDREIKRQVALRGGTTPVTAHARLGLALAEPSPIEAANYMSHYFEEIVEHIGARAILSIQVELFSQAGQVDRALRTLEDLCSQESLSEAEEGRLRTLIPKGEESDPAEAYREQFKESDSIVDLRPLVFQLMAQKDWENLCMYAKVLFDRTQRLEDGECLGIALFNAGKICQLGEFLESIDETLRARSTQLRLLLCWTLYHRGEIREAREKLAALEPEWDEPAYRGLRENLAITSGDWNSLSTMIERDWSERAKRTAQSLIRAAQLAAHLSLPQARGLLFAAGQKGEDDPEVLVAAYVLAARMGLEGEEEVSKWIERAASLSGEGGPLTRMPIEGFLAQKSMWDRRESEVNQLISRGEIPLFLAGQSLNRSLVEAILLPALRNPRESDPRARWLVAAYSGSRERAPRELGKSAGFDPSALLTLGYLDLLEEAFAAFEEVYLAHSTLGWLFEERQRAVFHQPSRVQDASEVSRMVASGTLERLPEGTAPDSELSEQIGEELAQLLRAAEKEGHGDGLQRLVVHPFPIHRVGSLLTEEVDLADHASVLVSCGAVVDRLSGQLTAQASKRAKAYLEAQERRWPTEPAIADGAVLYMAGLSITYLQHLGILGEISRAGFRMVVSPTVISEAEELVGYQEVSEEADKTIERIRSAASEGIETGKVRLGRSPDVEHGGPSVDQGRQPHPTEYFFGLGGRCDALICDDRFLNQHAAVESQEKSTPTFTTLDLIHALKGCGRDRTEELEYRTRLRRSGYFHVQVEAGELEHYLRSSPVREGRVIERAELRAVRESILCVRMRDVLRMPEEAQWLADLLRTFAQVLNSLWTSDLDLSETRVRSDWIVDQMDIRGWAHCFGAEARRNLIGTGQGVHLLPVLSPPAPSTPEVRAEFWKWAEETVLAPIKEQDPELFSWMIEFQRRVISEVAAKDPGEEGRMGWLILRS